MSISVWYFDWNIRNCTSECTFARTHSLTHSLTLMRLSGHLLRVFQVENCVILGAIKSPPPPTPESQGRDKGKGKVRAESQANRMSAHMSAFMNDVCSFFFCFCFLCFFGKQLFISQQLFTPPSPLPPFTRSCLHGARRYV